MALFIEDGSGVIGANSYVSVADITSYLTDRNRQTENSWDSIASAAQEAAAIAATDYIEQKFSQRFKGSREHTDILYASSVLTFTQQPADSEQVTLGSVTYTFNASLGGANSVLIGDKIADTIDNLVKAVNGGVGAGSVYGSGTVANADVSASAFYGLRLLAYARYQGEDGNLLASTTTVTGASWSFATLNGGNDIGLPQPLSFPRSSLFDRDGTLIVGIPQRLKDATAEYAVRAAGAVLLPDPTQDATGKVVTSARERVGPIETEYRYSDSATLSQLLKSYPAADRLLAGYLLPSGRVYRG